MTKQQLHELARLVTNTINTDNHRARMGKDRHYDKQLLVDAMKEVVYREMDEERATSQRAAQDEINALCGNE